jgi:lipopolysaccharide export system permease protein
MRTLDRYVANTVWNAVLMVLLVILSLDTVSDLVDQTADLRSRYSIGQALIYVTLKIPGSAVDYLGFAALIGCLIGVGTLANRSEITVIRGAGVSKLRLFWTVLKPVLVMVIGAMLIAEYLAPNLEQIAESRKDLLRGDQAQVQETGLWIQDEDEFVHANAVYPGGVLFGLARYQVNDNQLERISFAERASYQGSYWLEEGVVETRIGEESTTATNLLTRRWETDLTPDLLNMASLNPDQLSIADLQAYSLYLGQGNPLAGRYQVALWQQLLLPFSVAALVLVGLSFVYGSNRQAAMGQRIFLGVIIAIVFQVAQDILGPASVIWGFPAWLAVSIPILITAVGGLLLSLRCS